MACIFRGRASAIMCLLTVLPALLFSALSSAMAQLYEQPVLVVDPGMHTSVIQSVGADAAGRFAVTGSYDKTVRVWSTSDGKLLQTIHMPIGPDNVGAVYAVAMNPVGDLVAVGGWTRWNAEKSEHPIYLFEWQTGKVVARIDGPRNVTHCLAFSLDGRYLAAGVGTNGLHVYDRDRHWTEVFRDTNYGGDIHGLAFARDGRLATTSFDNKVRLYDSDFKLALAPRGVAGRPFRIAFSPDDATLAVGFEDGSEVALFDARSLTPSPGPSPDGPRNANEGNLVRVAWSTDGKTLYAGGRYHLNIEGRQSFPILAWADAGRGDRRTLPAGQNSVGGIFALPDGSLFVAATDPMIELLGPDGEARWAHHSPKAEFSGPDGKLAVSTDGAIIDFGFEQLGKSAMRFDVRSLKLSQDPPSDQLTNWPTQTGLAIEGWRNNPFPTLAGKTIKITGEQSRSLAIHPQGDRFVFGENWALEAFDATGQHLWRRNTAANGVASAVNITGDGRLVVAGFSDGTIRWHRMDDGRELLALYVLDKHNWVAWTPEGFYAATPGAFGVLRWQVNHGFDAAGVTVPISAIPRLRRPDALALVLQELETTRALGVADLKAARRDVQIATGSTNAPGARLHVLTIGVSDYGEKAKDLRLKFADRDAQDVASALVNTQEGGLYAEVKPIFLHDGTANKDGIFDALAAMQRNMANDAGQDLAVVMFSGHGTMIDGQFYLVPYGADDSTPARLKSSGIAASEFQSEVLKLASYGRVLVLLDACRSAGLIGGATSALSAADALKSALAANNVTVLTSSAADKPSREDDRWQHGAFTKVMLDALSSSADDIDTDRDGVISMAEFAAYIAKHLPELTQGDQRLGLDQRFEGDLFVAGL
jgi:WD40 repeat protein